LPLLTRRSFLIGYLERLTTGKCGRRLRNAGAVNLGIYPYAQHRLRKEFPFEIFTKAPLVESSAI
jgi:hypothetical protein